MILGVATALGVFFTYFGWFRPVKAGFACLFLLQVTRNAVEMTIFLVVRTCLVEMEGDLCLQALLAQGYYPVVVADPGSRAGFTTGHDHMDMGIQIGCEIDGSQERFTDYAASPDRHLSEKRQPVIGLFLIFAGGADRDIAKPRSPRRRETSCCPVNALGNDDKMQILALAHYFPDGFSPCICVFHKKI